MESKEKFFTPSGTETIKTYQKQIVNGEPVLVETGTTNIVDKIQESKDECDIHKIMERCACGDFSGLRGDKPIYGDFSQGNMHENINTVHQTAKQAQNNYNSLSDEEKAIIDKYLKGEKIEKKEETPTNEEEKGDNVNE